MNNNYNPQSTIYNLTPGFSLVEIILAIALFGLFATALLGLLMNSYASDFQAAEREVANLYARQGIEAVWSIRRQAWNLLENGDYGLDNSSGYWQFSGSSDSLNGKYTRIVTIADICRSSGEIVDCPDGIIDLHTKKATVSVAYTAITGVINHVELASYLTTWQSKDFVQTDWSGGAGQALWSDAARYFSDDGNIDYGTAGEIKLANLGTGGCGTKIWPFTVDTNYIFNPADIEVTGGFAQLANQGGGGAVSGSTLNSGFDADTANWTYSDWNQGGGEVNVTGSRQSSGGNPGGWVYINIPRGSRDELGGYWQQPFTTTVDNPTVIVDFDWQVTEYNPVPNTFQMYVFVDSSPGDPSIGQAVWSSGEITSTHGWTSQIDIDASSRVGSAGTYYLKIAVWIETPGSNTGPFTVGYDNVLLEWSGTTVPSYSTDRPDIYPDDSYDVSSIDAWSSFSETAIKNGGEIYYQLYDGVDWRWFFGGSWTIASSDPDIGNYNTASVISANISSFPISNQEIKFKAFLQSDGIQQVRLDEVKISCAQYYDWKFNEPDPPSVYTYNTSEIEVTGGEAQLLGSVGSCTGTATLCPGLPEATCNTQDGCSWSGGGCSNNGVCGDITNKKACDACNGCSWNNPGKVCQGIRNCSAQPVCTDCSICSLSGFCIDDPGATPCTDLPEATCNTQDGCLWAGGSYPTSSDIYPTNYYNTPIVWEYTVFAETANKNGGEIYYQLSLNDTPDQWYWWNNASGQINKWEVAGPGQYNTAVTINDNILLFPTTTQQINFKAFLTGDGSQQIQMDNVRIGWGEELGSGYATSGWLESSAFDTGNFSAFNFLSWVESLPSANEDIQVQLATAPNSGGSPGAWSAWMGLTGDGSYYTSPDETLIPLSNGHNDAQWIKCKVFLSGDGVDTPVLEEIKINYTP